MKKNLRKNRNLLDSEKNLDYSNIEESKEMKTTRTIVCIVLVALSLYYLGIELTLANSAFAITYGLIQNVVVLLYYKYKGEVHNKYLYIKILILIISVSFLFYSAGITLAVPTIFAGLISSAFRLYKVNY
jgi:uncharacterized membrane protein SpoIIM required for sporulation